MFWASAGNSDWSSGVEITTVHRHTMPTRSASNVFVFYSVRRWIDNVEQNRHQRGSDVRQIAVSKTESDEDIDSWSRIVGNVRPAEFPRRDSHCLELTATECWHTCALPPSAGAEPAQTRPERGDGGKKVPSRGKKGPGAPARGGHRLPWINQGGPFPPWKYLTWSEHFQAIVCQ